MYAQQFVYRKVITTAIVIVGIICFCLISSSLLANTIKPGVTITKENFSQYENELKNLTDPSTFLLIKEALESGLVTLPIIETKKYPECKLYYKYTKEYKGTCSIDSKGRLVGYKAGMPFPDPKNAAEVAYNLDRRETSGDGPLTDRGAFYLFRRGGIPERTIWWS